MKDRELGSTGLRVSEIGLGGEWLQRHTDAEVCAVFDACDECGINVVDSWLAAPDVRTRIGDALRGRRDRWVIEGHIAPTWQNGQYVCTRDLKYVEPAFRDLLDRLHTDFLDIGMVHYVDRPDELTEMLNGSPFMRYVQKLKSCGNIRHIGISTHNAAVAQMAAQSGEVDVILFSINPAFDMLPPSEDMSLYFSDEYRSDVSGQIDPARARMYALCAQRGVGIHVMKAYAGGRLFDARTSPFGAALTPVQCLHYALTRPAVASVMVGCDTPAHVYAAAAYETASESDKDYASVLAAAPKHAYGGQCTYCGHCAPCPAGIDVAMVNKFTDLAAMQPEVPDGVRAHYLALGATAADCIACGGCETRCPFHVPVIDRMAQARKRFGQA